MKKTFFLLVAAALMISACSNNNEQPQPEGQATIRFEVTNYEQVSLDEVTRAAATALAHLEMAIYDASTLQLVDSIKTKSGDSGYGSFSASLPFGDYVVLFLGFDGSRQSILKNIQSIGFTENNVPNLFHKVINLTVSPSSATSQDVTLSRAVAAFSIKSQGYIPTNLQTLTIVATGGGYKLNGQTGWAANVAQRTTNFNVSAYAGKESVGVSVYSFLPSEEANMNFSVTATTSNGEVLAQKDFSNVPMKINQRTIYTGSLFGDGTQAQDFNLSLENDVWNDVNLEY